MNRIASFLIAFLSLAAVLPLEVFATPTEQYTMPKKDGVQGDKTVSGSLTFYDMGGPDKKTVTSYAGYTRFVPATEGNQIRITFDAFELTGAAAVYVYDGDIDFTKYNDPVPEGYMAKLTGTLAGDSFESTSGSLSVMYHSKSYSDGGFGWEATVEEFTPSDMTWSGVSVLSGTSSPFRGQDSAPIIGVNLLTQGSRNPFTCTELTFTLQGTTQISDLSNLRVLYSKGQQKAVGTDFGVSANASDGTVTFSGNQTLRGGDNYFWLVADVAADAPSGNEVSATLTGATVAGEQRVSSPIASPETSVIANVAWLSASQKTYSVGDAPLTLYDDGGPEGTISLDFDGQATFKPTTEGKVIKATFTSLDLFNTSSIGKNDILNIYSGTEREDNALLATLLNDPTPVAITSMASDGSLTISLTSLTGTNPKPGFVAIIEEVEPQNMIIQGVEVSHPTTEPVCADEKNAEILLIKVNTQGTLAPCTVNTMSFTNSSTAPVAKATLYWLGNNAQASGTLAGETLSPEGEFNITLATPQSLRERDNYFMLKYDIAPNAVNAQNADGVLTKINADYSVENGSPEGSRSIENVCYSDDATVTKTIFGTWKFRNKKSAYSSYAYDATKGNQITTFVPGTPGKIVEIEFDKFKLRTSSYMSAPVFKVLDGKDITAPVLWEATTSNDYSNGPAGALRPTNAEGALTVLFNSSMDATSGYGFEAEVREYESVPMTFVSSKAIQLNNGGNVRPSATDFPVLAIENTMAGDKNPLAFDGMTLDLKEGYNAVKKVKIYATGDKNEFATTTLLAQADVQGRNVTLTPSAHYAMPERTSYMWVAFDMVDTMESDLKVDAAVTELKIGGKAVTVTDPDPEGEAFTKNIIYFDGSGRKVTVSGSLLFYDNGGPEGKYTTENSGTMTFVPGAEGEVIRMTVQEFYTNYQDHLYFYEGADVSADAKLLQDLSSSKKPEDLNPIISKSADGSITVKFEPKKNNINNGWAILVESFVPQPMAVKGVEVTAVNDTKMLRGSSDNKLLKLAVRVEGEKDAVSITQFDFSVLESDTDAITGAKVWYTGTDDVFDLSTQYGTTATEAPYIVSGDMSFDTAGTYYFWYTYDIASEAATDAKVQAQFVSLTAGGICTSAADEKKVLVTVQEGMHGTYSVGTSGEFDFRTISEAVDAMKEGIDGPVVFELEAGNYNELVCIPEVIGSSKRNTVTLRSKSGNREDVVISYNSYRDPGSANYDKRYGVVTFDGIDYCNLEDVTVTTTETAFPGLVFFRNKSEHVTLNNCIFRMPKSTDTAKGSYLVYMYVKSGDVNRNHNNTTVRGCLFDGGYIGMGLTGTSTVAHPKQHGGMVLDNVFRNQGSKAIYLANEEDAVITGNDILMEGDVTSSPYGMDLSEAGGDLTVSGNVIRFKECSGRYTPNPMGMYLRIYNIGNVKDGHRRIFNNEINMTNCPGSGSAAIRVNNDIPGLEIVNNTMRIAAANTDGERVNGIYLAGTVKGGRIMNNIIQLDTPGYMIYAQRKPYLEGADISHNVVYTPGENFGYIGGDPNGQLPEGFTEGSMSFSDFCQWAPMTDSFMEQTEFLSDNVLEPASAGSLLNGMPVDYVTTDLYGAERAQLPTIGAYEYAASTVAPAMVEGYPVLKEVTHDTALVVVKSTLTGTMSYALYEADKAAPDVEAVKNEDLTTELRKGVETEITLKSLRPNTSYRMYAVLSSLRGMDSEVIASEVFTTTYEPTRIATFEEAVQDETRITDGTMSFTGFSIVDIEDGVEPAPNTKAAYAEDGYAVIQITNAPDLGLEGLFMRNNEPVTLTSKSDKLKVVTTKTVEPSDAWRYVELRDMGKFTYLELESDGDIYIDNVGANPLQILLTIDRDEDITLTAGEEYALTVAVDGGVAPYQYRWSNAANEQLAASATYTFTPQVSGTYTVAVTDARGASASTSTKVRVLGDMAVATFDDLYLPEESHWCGDTQDEDYMLGSFFSGSFEFNNSYMADWDSWAFFGYSNHTSTDFGSFATDQWNSAAGQGAEGSANYGVVFVSNYMGKTETTLTNTKEGQTIPGMYVTNSAWVVDAILNGDGISDGPFGKDDTLMLNLKGVKADGSETLLEIPLADYRNENEADRWYLDTWQWVDLSSLGDVVSLEWDMSSTKQNSFGMTTPSYVCIDNVGAQCPVKDAQAAELAVNEEKPADSFDLTPYFSFAPDAGTIAYTMNTDDTRLSLSGSTVTYSGEADASTSLTACATQRGCRQWVRIPVNVSARPSGIDNVELEGVNIYPNPADAYTIVAADADKYDLQIISMDGRIMMSLDSLTGKQTLNVSTLAEGTYIVRLADNEGHTSVRKLIIKH